MDRPVLVKQDLSYDVNPRVGAVGGKAGGDQKLMGQSRLRPDRLLSAAGQTLQPPVFLSCVSHPLRIFARWQASGIPGFRRRRKVIIADCSDEKQLFYTAEDNA